MPMAASPLGVKMMASMANGTRKMRDRKLRRFQIPWPMEMSVYRYKPVAGALSRNDSTRITTFAAMSPRSSLRSAFASSSSSSAVGGSGKNELYTAWANDEAPKGDAAPERGEPADVPLPAPRCPVALNGSVQANGFEPKGLPANGLPPVEV